MGCFFNPVVLPAERVLPFVRDLANDRAAQSVLVASMDPFHGFPFEPNFGFPRAEAFYDFDPVQPDDGFGQGVVAVVPDASDGHVDSGFEPPAHLFGRLLSGKPGAVQSDGFLSNAKKAFYGSKRTNSEVSATFQVRCLTVSN